MAVFIGAIGAGFGPSTGMSAAACESSEARLAIKTKSLPPAIGAIVFTVAFLGILSGMCMIHLNEELLGGSILVTTVAIIASLIIWAIRARR